MVKHFLAVLIALVGGCVSYAPESAEGQPEAVGGSNDGALPEYGSGEHAEPPVGGGCGHDVYVLPTEDGGKIIIEIPLPCSPIEFPLDDPPPFYEHMPQEQH